jgi:glycosyltransferase involved in cell wall biosynthesis
MVPSKIYYAMAAVGLCDNDSEVVRIICRRRCGIVVNPGDPDAMVNAIEDSLVNKSNLDLYRANNRDAAEKSCSRKNTNRYLQTLADIILSQQQ